jgi:hypothetical protein
VTSITTKKIENVILRINCLFSAELLCPGLFASAIRSAIALVMHPFPIGYKAIAANAGLSGRERRAGSWDVRKDISFCGLLLRFYSSICDRTKMVRYRGYIAGCMNHLAETSV